MLAADVMVGAVDAELELGEVVLGLVRGYVSRARTRRCCGSQLCLAKLPDAGVHYARMVECQPAARSSTRGTGADLSDRIVLYMTLLAPGRRHCLND
jgi:hypothetical protein